MDYKGMKQEQIGSIRDAQRRQLQEQAELKQRLQREDAERDQQQAIANAWLRQDLLKVSIKQAGL